MHQHPISILGPLGTLPHDQYLNMFPWTHRSITGIKTHITYPAASTNKTGATVSTVLLRVHVSSSAAGGLETEFLPHESVLTCREN